MLITVLMGGVSSERDVSLASGVRIVEALRERGHDVTAVDTATGVLDAAGERAVREAAVKREPPSLESLKALSTRSLSPTLGTLPALREADVVFLALHGGQGEDGTLQAVLDMAGIRYTGSGRLASSIAMDKDISKTLFRAAGVPTASWLMAPVSDNVVERELGFPVVVKPSKQGSTVGLTVVRNRAGLQPAIVEANLYDDEVMVESFVGGRELTVGVLGDQPLPVGEIIPRHEIYDYECKYTKGMATEEFPARLSEAESDRIRQLAVASFRALKLTGCARIDFRMASDERGGATKGEFYCLEANTLPGMTELSLIPQAAVAAGMSFPDLCERIVALAGEPELVRSR
ncbi:MAG: D-alanine--D-alanine ligase [Gemmatimonadaceae bacterium]